MTQKNYFKGAYMGCDIKTKLGIPNWEILFKSWGIKSIKLKKNFINSNNFLKHLIVLVQIFLSYLSILYKLIFQNHKQGNKRRFYESNPIHNMSLKLLKKKRKIS